MLRALVAEYSTTDAQLTVSFVYEYTTLYGIVTIREGKATKRSAVVCMQLPEIC